MVKHKATGSQSIRIRKPKIKVSFVWTDQEMQNLVAQVENHKCIYDEKCAENKTLRCRTNAWALISTALGEKFPVDQCQANGGNEERFRIQNKLATASDDAPYGKFLLF